MAESGPSGEKRDSDNKELVQGDPPASGPLVSPSDNVKANGMWAVPLIVPLLTIPSTNLVTSAIPDPGQEVPDPNKGKQNVADEKKSDWKSTASATAKLFLRGVRDTADAFGPLKSVAGGLCFILDNCEVRFPTNVCHLQRLQVPQRMAVNRQAIELLVSRVWALSTSLCESAPGGNLREQERRERLER